MSDFFCNHNIISIFQSGFRKYHSTETALLKITDDIRLAMDRGLFTLLALLDFSKAFDTVIHKLLIKKLKRLGFSKLALAWIKSYLSGRKQCVSYDNLMSDFKTVTCGVPQGSILGPLLFIVYINDISTVLRYCMFHCYADDIQIYIHFNIFNKDQAVKWMNEDIKRLVQWAVRNGLKLNPDKTKPMIVCHQRLVNSVDLQNTQKITVDGTLLPYVTSDRNKVTRLGLIKNQTLGWTDIVVYTCNRVFAAVHTLKRMQGLYCFI